MLWCGHYPDWLGLHLVLSPQTVPWWTTQPLQSTQKLLLCLRSNASVTPVWCNSCWAEWCPSKASVLWRGQPALDKRVITAAAHTSMWILCPFFTFLLRRAGYKGLGWVLTRGIFQHSHSFCSSREQTKLPPTHTKWPLRHHTQLGKPGSALVCPLPPVTSLPHWDLLLETTWFDKRSKTLEQHVFINYNKL